MNRYTDMDVQRRRSKAVILYVKLAMYWGSLEMLVKVPHLLLGCGILVLWGVHYSGLRLTEWGRQKMTQNGSRLDVPGFSHGIKTGEFIDVPRIFGGKAEPKRSRKPHSVAELLTSGVVSRARKAIQRSTRLATEDYYKRKRVRYRAEKKAITNHTPVRACNRRFFEHMGMKAQFLSFEEDPEPIISRASTAYEITDGFCPFITTTSVREALIICASLARYGIATEVYQFDIKDYNSTS